MFDFQYIRPKDIHEAKMAISTHPTCCIMAGGTDALIQYRKGRRTESVVVDVLLPEMTGITETEDSYIIGASTPLSTTSRFFHNVPQPFSLLSCAADKVGTCQTRNLATIGGNICTGISSADMATALLALDAILTIESLHDSRTPPINQFFLDNRRTALSPGELVTSITVHKTPEMTCGSGFFKVGKRHGHSIAILNAAAFIAWNDCGVITHAKLAVGNLAPVPIRLHQCEELLVGMPCHDTANLASQLEKIKQTIQSEIHPRDSYRSSEEYRRRVAPVALERVIRSACGLEG